jgi:hypothetical protein
LVTSEIKTKLDGLPGSEATTGPSRLIGAFRIWAGCFYVAPWSRTWVQRSKDVREQPTPTVDGCEHLVPGTASQLIAVMTERFAAKAVRLLPRCGN